MRCKDIYLIVKHRILGWVTFLCFDIELTIVMVFNKLHVKFLLHFELWLLDQHYCLGYSDYISVSLTLNKYPGHKKKVLFEMMLLLFTFIIVKNIRGDNRAKFVLK